MGIVILDATGLKGKRRKLLNDITKTVQSYIALHNVPDTIYLTEQQLEYIWTSGQLRKYDNGDGTYDALLMTPFNSMEVKIKKPTLQ